MTNMTQVEKMAEKFHNSLDEVKKELKKVQTQKFRLNQQQGKADFSKKMTEILQYEQLLKNTRSLLDPKEKAVTTYEQSDVDQLDYDETIKAIRSIQSKKALTKWQTTEAGNNDDYRAAEKIEQMLLEHKQMVKPLDDEIYIRKTDLQTIIDTIKTSGNISKDKIIDLLESLI